MQNIFQVMVTLVVVMCVVIWYTTNILENLAFSKTLLCYHITTWPCCRISIYQCSGSSKILQIVSNPPHHYTVLQLRGPEVE